MLIAEINDPQNRLGGEVTQLSGTRIGDAVFRISRPYATIYYEEETGVIRAEPAPLFYAKPVKGKSKMDAKLELLLPSIEKDIVDNNLPYTVANETLQNSKDAVFNPDNKNWDKWIKIQIYDETSTDGVPECVVVIEDNGIGMSQKDMEDHLLALGAKGKEGILDSRGYGLAKAGFLLPARWARVTSVKHGKKTVMQGTRKQFYGIPGAGVGT